MSRYIDAELIDFSRLNNDFDRARAKIIIMGQPTADVAPVVRCKDCINAKPYERADGETGYYCQNNNSTFRYGTNWERLYEPTREANDYCSYGERREK